MSSIGAHINSLSSPALVVDLAAVKNNCDEMLARAAEAGIKLRGQTKTHKTVEGAVLQTGGTKRYILTVEDPTNQDHLKRSIKVILALKR